MSEPIPRLNAALEGRYRIERQLGEGGMATVYLADDLKHERKVALKVLKPELAAVVGAERFLAEIKTTANLQHPHILPLFDSGEADGFLFYVMPFVQGEDLRERLDREHQLPVDEAVRIATNVAEALDYAHKQGVIHRDIKPANILLQEGKPVVSDFGIALAVGAAGGGRLTETGLSLGTPHYMSPEQATGDVNVGAATDIYALGCVLYEMLVAEPPYTGGTPQAILGKIVTGEPEPVTVHRRSVPPNVDAALHKALEKVPADRFTDASEFASALADPGFHHGAVAIGHATGRRSQWTPVAWIATGLASGLALALGAVLLRPDQPEPTSRQVLSSEGWAGLGVDFGRYAAIAPDGSSMILPARLPGRELLLGVKMRGSTEIAPITGTTGARDVVYSPDGQWIAYAVGSELFKRPLVGGSAVRLAQDTQSEAGPTAAHAWLDDGTILYEQYDPGEADSRGHRIVRIPEDGGEPSIVFWPESPISALWVHGLPEARGALVSVCPTGGPCGAQAPQLYVVDLRNLSSKLVLEQVVRAWYAPTGHLVYVRNDGAVFAVPFDLDALEIRGGAVPLFEGVRVRSQSGVPDMRLASDGTLAYVEVAADAGSGGVLVFVDRNGQEEPVGIEPGGYDFPRFSPEGERLAAVVLGPEGDRDIWVFDLVRGARSRITFGGQNRFYPVWRPTGDALAFSDGAGAPNAVLLAASDGRGGIETLLERDGVQFPTSWSADGRVLVYHENHPETLRDIWTLPVDGEPRPFLVTPFEEGATVFSPNGRWLAYTSNKSGRQEVYVQPYPGPGAEFTVSTDGGTEALWSPDGSELFYRGPRELMVVTVDAGETFRADTPRPLFQDVYAHSPSATVSAHNYDVSPDGRRFVMVNPSAGGSGRLILVQNFFEELRERVPTQ